MGRKGRKARPRGLNKYQRAAFRLGEQRVGREEVQELLQLSRSADPAVEPSEPKRIIYLQAPPDSAVRRGLLFFGREQVPLLIAIKGEKFRLPVGEASPDNRLAHLAHELLKEKDIVEGG